MRCFTICLFCVALVGGDSVSEREEMKERLNDILKNSPPRGRHIDSKGVRRIVGGDRAKRGEYPWMVSLHYKGKFKCGGSIYNKRTIITMAHCVMRDPDQEEGNFFIIAGDHKFKAPDDFDQKVFVREIIMYPQFKVTKFGNDLAVLKLEESLEMNRYVQSIEIPEPWKEEWLTKRDDCMFAGWGWTDFPDKATAWALNHVEAPIWSRPTCWKYLKQNGVKLRNNMLCTLKFGHGGCLGDSGAALVCYDANDEPYQVGALEFGEDDCRDGLGVHSRLSRYKEWIAEVSG